MLDALDDVSAWYVAIAAALAAVTPTLIGNVANVVGIDAFRTAKLVIARFGAAQATLDRTLSLWPGLVRFSPTELRL